MDVSVVVAGAGPAGLMLAGELRLAGVDVLVVDRLAEPTAESRGMGFTARTMEVLRQRGLLHRFGGVTTSIAGHFGSLPLDFTADDGIHASVSGVPQSYTEAVLGAWAADLGVSVRRGHELIGVTDDGDGVDVEIRGPGGTERLRAAYLVGCDGGRSTVRKLAGFDFPGTDATVELLLADVSGCDIRPRFTGDRTEAGIVLSAPLGEDVSRVVVCEYGVPGRRTEPVSFEEVAAAWMRLTGEDISRGTPRWASSFTDAARLVTTYRRGRVLLAGDAAHVHLPAGGQGMNVSIQDSVNLGWKLGAVVNGWAPEGLLDTYHSERFPVGQQLLTQTRAQGLLFFGGWDMQPLRDVMAELIGFDAVNRHLIGKASGLDIRYDVGPGDHPALGLRMPDIELITTRDAADTGRTGKTTVARLLRGARGVLIDLADDAALRRTAAGWSDRVDIVTATPHDLPSYDPFSGTAAVLLRPDGHVVWTGPGAGELTTALSGWFGPLRKGL
ncbi:FAD-dependent monooxygenase [Streptomyces sp. NPDC005791]|uniref:FAD-dependent monooxygenase n=1 Tax=unclassified Streptomyces TaxID=2593676 RepID=UPI0033C2C384